MNIADEGSSAHLQATLYAKRTVSEIGVQQVTQDINGCFEQWGLPVAIKIDNGRPLVHPHARDIPTLTKLWWIGLGIKVIQNAPRCPQQNGIVESLQGTICNWSNPKGQLNMADFQQRVNHESDFQRNHYQIPAKDNKTRMELHPELASNPRQYHPTMFDINRVYQYLSKKVWTRTLRSSGDVKFFSKNIYIGKKYNRMTITIIFDPEVKCWRFSKQDGTLLKTSTVGVPSKEQIISFATMSKN